MSVKTTTTSPWPYLLGCLAVFLVGGLFTPGAWYAQLNLAPWNPPPIVFPIVWTILYVCIGVAGWQIGQRIEKHLITLWWVQLLANGVWSWLFFGQHWTVIAMLDLAVLVCLVAYLTYASWRLGARLASLLLSPYLAWLILAASLNAYVVIYN